ncbi:hypothetical protein OAB00_04080 [Akkermansiaceae bacterium]|nr:hypothetical protein [Akkermansiaceae bacterium]
MSSSAKKGDFRIEKIENINNYIFLTTKISNLSESQIKIPWLGESSDGIINSFYGYLYVKNKEEWVLASKIGDSKRPMIALSPKKSIIVRFETSVNYPKKMKQCKFSVPNLGDLFFNIE